MIASPPVLRRVLRPLWLALWGSAAFMITASILGVLTADYDPFQQAVSALSLGEYGWMQQANFVMLGSLMLYSAPSWARLLKGGYGQTAYPLLTGVVGASFVALAFMPQDPAPGYDPAGLSLQRMTVMGAFHLAIAAVAAGSSSASLFVIAKRFEKEPEWSGWDSYTRIMAVGMVGCAIVYAAWSTESAGLAGIFERLVFVIPIVWGATLLTRLQRGSRRRAVGDSRSGVIVT